MKRIYGGIFDGLYPKLPTLCAELKRPMNFCPRGARVYCVTKPDPDLNFVEVLGHTRLNRIVRFDVPWDALRYPEIHKVRAVIAERCWRGTKDETAAALEMMKEKLGTVSSDVDPFAPDVEV
ncbi:MAG: hypothetical protein E6Q97_35675 [Desulfurellales bacterium]|nr:MAG: hypothetical protein E6Q97_35675 [Desulfurellales bacterium]